jgi:hypothetical protein
LGAAFLPLKQHGREFGLAFAAELLVHLALASWFCWCAANRRTHFFRNCRGFCFFFLHFSLSVICTRRLVRRGGSYWAVGMNFILYAFLRDFMQNP